MAILITEPSLYDAVPDQATTPFPASQTPESVDVVSWDELRAGDRIVWEQIRAGTPHYRSPFFSTAFCDAVHAARGDLCVAIVRGCGRSIGFLPFHRLGQVAVPPGRCFNEAHDVLVAPQTHIDWLWLLRECGLKSYNFHALMGTPDPSMESCHLGTVRAFNAQLGGDSPGYLARLERKHKTIRRQAQKSRKLEREVGPLRWDLDCRDGDVLEQVIELKRQHYRRTNVLDYFTPQWTRQLVRTLHAAPKSQTRGMLSILRAGDRLVAGHIGIVEGALLHYWFPAYDTAFARYSPGTALFKEVMRAATENGIDCIDMGCGEQPYKWKQTDRVTRAAYGCITPSPLYWRWQFAAERARSVAKKVPMKEGLRRLLRQVRPMAGISQLD